MKSKSQSHSIKDLKRLPLLFSIETSKLKFDENGAPEEIQVLMCGKWNHPMYGPIIIEPKDITEFKAHFDDGLRRDIPVTEGHESFDEKPAVGWFKELTDKGKDGLWASMEWTPKGKTLLADKAYKYFSPEFYTEYEDPESREIYKNVLVGGALTNKPYFKKMAAVVLSEHSINKNYIFTDMKIETIVAKKVEELTAEEQTFLKEHKAELTAEQLATFGSVLEDAGGEKPEDKKEEKKDGKGDGKTELTAEQKADNVAKGLNEDGTAKVEASDKNVVKISMAEYNGLRTMANKGAQAFDENRKNAIKAEVSKLVFSDKNSTGKVLAKDEAKVFTFMQGLTENQRKMFSEIVEAIPSSKLFNEIGNGGASEGSAFAEIKKLIASEQEKNKKLSFADGLKIVTAANPELAKRYASELVA